MSKRNQVGGAFGGLYNHEVIRQLRAELAQKNIILAAVIEHTGMTQPQLQEVASKFLAKKKAEIEAGQG